jgi:hypothetical protein
MKKDFKPEQKPSSEQQPIVLPTATDSAKPNVVCSQSRVTTNNVEAIIDEVNPILNELNLILSKRLLTKKDIAFPWNGEKVIAFISCD